MSGVSRFCQLVLAVSFLIGCQSQLALSQGFSRLEPQVAVPQPVRPILRTGSQGNAVSELQAALKLLGYYSGAVDGTFNESTAIAVSQFQQAAGLRADGIVGRATWEKLFPLNPPTLPAPTDRTARSSNSTTTSAPTNRSTTTSNNTAANSAPTNRSTTTSNNSTTTSAPTNRSTTTSNNTAANSPPTNPPVTNSNTNVTATLESSSQSLPTLKLGMRGPEVFWLQKRLQTAGFFQGSVDGIFGRATEDAVKAAQARYGLNADGVVGPGTWRALLR